MHDHEQGSSRNSQIAQAQHPDKRVMMIAEKGTMGVGSSRMSGVNNVALWTGIQASPYVPFVNIAPIVAGTNGISPIFLTTVGVTGGIGIDLQNWVKKLDEDGKPILNNDGNPVLEQVFSVETGTVLTIDTKAKKLYDGDETEELVDISDSFSQTRKKSSSAQAALMRLSLARSYKALPAKHWVCHCNQLLPHQKKYLTKAKA